MDKDTRNAIERATQRARKLLEEDFAAQLEGDFDVQRDGAVAAKAGGHLSARQAFQRERIVAAIEHKRAAGMSAADAAHDYLRDAAFTTLNRFVALKMLEARDLVQECITKGEQSAGYREFCGMAPGLPLLPDSAGYRLYIESLFDELSTEVKVLFDRRDLSSVLWPKRATFEQLLKILNAIELARVWCEDETIGWVYQFFNGQDERRTMREESQAPRNSHELAVRNQFFTPRYVVQFLTDNTLGRIWYEMRATRTALSDKCEYMMQRSGEDFAPRAKKDPRDLRVLDPACGSGHFLLYAFDLLLAIYEEAHADGNSPKSDATGKTLAEDYPSLEALRKAVPGLVLAHNLHGVDIDPRCAQIAQLALWMRAQKACRDWGIGRADREQIRRSNIVVAEPLVADEQLAREFAAKLNDAELGRAFTALVESLSLAGEMGLLLRIEELVRVPAGKQGELLAPPEERIRDALKKFVGDAANQISTRRRLFADDAAHGADLLGVAEKRFDAVLMNPPFGRPTSAAQAVLASANPDTSHDIAAAMMHRGQDLLCRDGLAGVIAPRPLLLMRYLESWRRTSLLPHLAVLADLGLGVMDDAMVRSCCFVLSNSSRRSFDFLSTNAGSGSVEKDRALISATRADYQSMETERFASLPYARIVFRGSDSALERLGGDAVRFEPEIGTARQGPTTSGDFRFLRLWWEVAPESIGRGRWEWHPKNGEGGPYWRRIYLVMNRSNDGHELAAHNFNVNGQTAQSRQSSTYYYRQGAYYLYRASRFAASVLPRNCVMAHVSPAVLSSGSMPDGSILAWINSATTRELIHVQAPAEAYPTGLVKNLPWPQHFDEHRRQEASRLALANALDLRLFLAHDERDPDHSSVDWFSPLPLEFLALRYEDARRLNESMPGRQARIDAIIREAYSIGEDDESDRAQEFPWPDVVKAPSPFDLASTLLVVAVEMLLGGKSSDVARPNDVFEEPTPARREPRSHSEAIAVCDAGSPADLATRLEAWLVKQHGPARAERWLAELTTMLGATDLRRWLSADFFSTHLVRSKASQRCAPRLWQLATRSSSYSVWLYIHAFNKDTLFRVQNDYVAPKLAYEERRLASLTSELRDGATAVGRGALAAQEAVVDELRTFLGEVKRVAPLWSPNLDDGVILNFAPLWRLVPQNKSWQKELKSTWDALREGTYDWAHLAMHLWPERVVPKCAKDRSLAIAHGLEDVFWVAGGDDKWIARKAPTRNVDDLIRGRTSLAVKSALKSLLEAPVASGTSAGRRGSGRRKPTSDAEGAP